MHLGGLVTAGFEAADVFDIRAPSPPTFFHLISFCHYHIFRGLTISYLVNKNY